MATDLRAKEALRRVAILVAGDAPPRGDLRLCEQETARVVGAESGAVVDFIPAGTVASLADDSTASRVYRTGRTAQLAQGLSPTALSEGGLGPALGDLLERSPLPVELDVTPERFPETIEWPPIT